MQQRKPQHHRKPRITPKECYFCSNALDIDYKHPEQFKRSISSYAKILPRKRTGLCSAHQRMLSVAAKRARYLALLPYTNR